MTDTPDAPRCAGVTGKGQPCTVWQNLRHADNGQWWCRWHDAERADERRAMQQEGARVSNAKRAEKRHERLALLSETAGPMPPIGDSLPEVTRWLQWALLAGSKGEIDRSTLIALTGAARLLLSAYTARDLEKQLKAATKELASLKRKAAR